VGGYMQNKNVHVLEPPTSRGYAVDVKMFYFTCNHRLSSRYAQYSRRGRTYVVIEVPDCWHHEKQSTSLQDQIRHSASFGNC